MVSPLFDHGHSLARALPLFLSNNTCVISSCHDRRLRTPSDGHNPLAQHSPFPSLFIDEFLFFQSDWCFSLSFKGSKSGRLWRRNFILEGGGEGRKGGFVDVSGSPSCRAWATLSCVVCVCLVCRVCRVLGAVVCFEVECYAVYKDEAIIELHVSLLYSLYHDDDGGDDDDGDDCVEFKPADVIVASCHGMLTLIKHLMPISANIKESNFGSMCVPSRSSSSILQPVNTCRHTLGYS